jgi:hypothetical protein
LRIEALLDPAAPRLQLLTGEDGLDRTVTGVMTTDLRDPGRYLHGGELVLTGMLWRNGPQDSEGFVRTVAEAGAVALAAGVAEVGPVPDDLVRAAVRHGIPLFSVPEDTAFGTITEYVVKQISTDRASDLAALVERHRMLVSATAGAGGLDAVLELLGGDLDLDCWVTTPTGRLVAGPADALPEARRQALARAALSAIRRGRPAPYGMPAAGDGTGAGYSILPVPAEDAEPQPLADWLLVIAGDVTEWTLKRRQLADNLARLAGAERARRDRGRALRARLADEVVDLLQHDSDPSELARALDAAAAMSGVDGAPPQTWLVVSAEGPGLPPYATKAAMAEALTDVAPQALVSAPGPGEAIALVPADVHAAAEAAEAGASGGFGEAGAADRLAGLLAPLDAALGADARLVLGVSAPAATVGGLRGALEEARHARRIAEARVARVSAAGPEQLASHVLLLAAVPDEIRRAFRDRLLARVVAYDLEHQADLVGTLEAFLRYDGSWTRCASALHVHVNTLRYRIRRIEELTGRDLSRLDDRVDFYLALELA